ncbi:hypothetical protein [Nonomuraea gerenzanensis]|uniref:Uncharacterized protein n=1 Tax=Nonomuraea gerenzanensis TaxID=93944 RepID=A0A1M4ECW5_9ACTN|nr:hypothetical protein [Nonomuraea gerenzanensis]UBU08377.1 hypothetical protein LCN96_28705 [Nonomuraea gerenzanensis]SBO96719.1 hypothetical protein BN4615_P6235 [Nonomuraea gerenzanensis]
MSPAYGAYSLTGLDPDRIRPTGKLSLLGGVIDVGDRDDRRTWVVFRLTSCDYEPAMPMETSRRYRSCVPRQRVKFTFEHEDVSELEAKVCWTPSPAPASSRSTGTGRRSPPKALTGARLRVGD